MDELISRQAAIDEIGRFIGYIDEDMIQRIIIGLKRLPSAESEIIECKDCKHRGGVPIADGRYWCNLHGSFMYYCSDAERRKENDSN